MIQLDKFLLSIKKRFLVPAIVLSGIGVWLSICHVHYQSYWLGTIYRVQTADFNMLHHTMPAVLSDMILADRDDLVQRTLDSTYGLFGLVITDPSGENILFRTDKVYHRNSWQDRVQPDMLLKESEPYDLLTDPPQLEPLFEHKTPRSDAAIKVASPAKGAKVLGRLYYLRSAPPGFSQDIGNFLVTGPWEMSGSKRGYFYITLSCVGFSLALLLLIYLRKRGLELKQVELEHVSRELEIRKKALENLGNELATQKARKVWLEREADQAYKRAINLKQSLERLRESLVGAMPAQSVQTNRTFAEMQGDLSGQNNFAPAAPMDLDPQSVQFTPVNPPTQGRPSQFKIRPPVAPPGSILEEIEGLLPALSENAKNLRSQADVLQDYCAALEERQVEMRKIVDNAFVKSNALLTAVDTRIINPQENSPPATDYMDMSPR